MVRILVAAGADVNAKEYEAGKFTAAHICVWFDETEALKALIDAGARQNNRNKNNRTIHALAVKKRRYNSKRVIENAGWRW